MLAVVCKCMQQLPTMLGPTVHRWKDTTHKMCMAPTMLEELSNIVALHFSDHGTKEM